VSHGFFPSVGGSERYHWFGARAVATFARVSVFTSDRNLAVRSGSDPPAKPPFEISYLRSTRLASENLVWPGTLWRALRAFQPDLVWGNHPSPTADLGAVFALATGRVWVATYHADVGSDRWWKRLYLRGETRLLRRARTVLVTSDRYREVLVARGIRPDRVVVAVPGPYIGDGTPPPAHPGVVRGPPGQFLFVGALDSAHAYKRIDLLFRAIATLRAEGVLARLEVVGDGEQRPEWEALARHLGLGEAVRFRGRVTDEELADCFASATALVLPAVTSAEGFGSVAVEAVQYGCPVVASSDVAVGGLLARDGAALVYDAASAGAMVEPLRRLATDPALGAALAERARSAASQFGWDAAMGRIVDALRTALPPSDRSAGTG
jgi:glycosyltransferase involved in cell wall biosynthesis